MRRHAKASSTGSMGDGEGRRPVALVAFTIVIAAVLLLASAAQAATTYRTTGERFATPGSGEGALPSAGQVAIDDATGDVLTGSRFAGKVNVYAPAGASATYLTSFGGGELGASSGLAVDQTARVAYVSDGIQGRIVKYLISGSGTPTFTPDPTFTSPPQGSGPGEVGSFASPLAVDPSNGDLLIADTGNQRVSRFTASGAFVRSFDGTDSLRGRFHQLSSLAVDAAGATYVVDIARPDILFEYGESFVERFGADGTADNSFAPKIQTPRTVAIDPNSGNLLVAGRSDGGYEHADGTAPFPIRLYVLDGDLMIDEVDFPAADAGSVLLGLAVDGGSSKRLYAATEANFLGGVLGVLPFDSVAAPDLVLDQPSALTTSAAHLSGSVDPLGHATSFHFEYSREGGPVQSTDEIALGAGSGPEPVSADLSGLIPNSDYSVRLVATATESGVTVASPPRQLRTLEAVPAVVSGEALDRTLLSATLLGEVDPFGLQTTYHFEYGPTTAYGSQVPVDHEDIAGNGRASLSVHAYLTGLQAGTEYHYRLVARNSAGVSAGADRTFLTRAASAPSRAYEQVSPVFKDGSEVNGLRGFSASPDGESLMYQWKTAPGDSKSGPVSPRSSAWRGSDWTSLGLDAPQLPGSATTALPVLTFTLGISEDGTRNVTNSLQKLAPGAVEGDSNLYLHDTRTDSYTTIVTAPGTELYASGSGLGREPIVDGTPSYSHVLFVSPQTLLPGAPEGALYEWAEGQLRIASIAPDGSPLGSVPFGGTSGQHVHDPHYISDDGSRVFFESAGTTYVRIGGEETVQIGGSFGGASRDGHYAFVYGTDLTGDSDPGVLSLYRFDVDTRTLELLTAYEGSTEGDLQVSANGASAFFASTAALVPGTVAGPQHLYVWHGDRLRLMATTPMDTGNPLEYMGSPNGSYFAFSAYSKLTAYDNSSSTACLEFNRGDPKDPVTGKGVACKEIYRYDVENEQLSCASCPRDGSAPTGDARMGPENVEGDFSYPRSMLDDGTVIFDTTEPLSGLDSNSSRDVYTFDGVEATLISAGATAGRSEFDEASADGSSIFFTTQDQLVGQDTDTRADVYVSRVGGGIPSQNPPPPRGECIRDDCKATPNAGPELPFGGSEGLGGPTNVKAPARKRCGKGSHARRVKGKSRCVKAHKKQAKSNRRQSR